MQRYFGYNGVLSRKTADEVWNLCNEKLREPSMSVRNLIRQSNVTLICTTDDPVDSLEWHKKIAEDDSFDVKVLPAWRPDKAMNIENPTIWIIWISWPPPWAEPRLSPLPSSRTP